MNVRGFMHTGLQVSDMDEAVHFYRDLLGLELVFDHRGDGWLAEARRGEPGTSVRIVVLRLGSQRIELLQFTPASDSPPEATSAGVAHLAFRVDDLALTHAALEDAGVEFLFEPREMFEGEPVTFAIGPDGVLIELIEIGSSGPGAEGIFGGFE